MLIIKKLLEVNYSTCIDKMCLDHSGENIEMSDAIHAEGYNFTCHVFLCTMVLMRTFLQPSMVRYILC
jgi:hypothetical protein